MFIVLLAVSYLSVNFIVILIWVVFSFFDPEFLKGFYKGWYSIFGFMIGMATISIYQI